MYCVSFSYFPSVSRGFKALQMTRGSESEEMPALECGGEASCDTACQLSLIPFCTEEKLFPLFPRLSPKHCAHARANEHALVRRRPWPGLGPPARWVGGAAEKGEQGSWEEGALSG